MFYFTSTQARLSGMPGRLVAAPLDPRLLGCQRGTPSPAGPLGLQPFPPLCGSSPLTLPTRPPPRGRLLAHSHQGHQPPPGAAARKPVSQGGRDGAWSPLQPQESPPGLLPRQVRGLSPDVPSKPDELQMPALCPPW